MADRDTDRYLEENGFKFQRESRIGEMWSDGLSLIVVSNAVRKNYRNWQNTMAEIRRAVRKREMVQKPIAKIGDVVKGSPIITRKANGEVKQIPSKEEVDHAAAQREFAKLQPPEIVPQAPEVQQEKTEVKPKKIRRFDPTTREVIKIRMSELIDQGITSPRQMKMALDREGFKMTNGDPMDTAWVGFNLNIVQNERQVKKLRQENTPPPKPVVQPQVAPPAPAAAPVDKLPDFVLAILKDTSLNDTKKVKILLAYVE